MRRRWSVSRLVLLGLLASIPWSRVDAQGTELARLVALYRSGNTDAAVTGLQALSRTAETYPQRALVEYHLGLALLRTRPAEAAAALRRSIATDPDLRPESAATLAEQKAWSDARERMRVPRGVRFEPSSVLAGGGDSLGVIVDVPRADGAGQPRVRVLLAGGAGRDPVPVWSGIAGDTGRWDGTLMGEFPASGVYPLIVEVWTDSTEAPLRWRRSVQIVANALAEPLPVARRPVLASAAVPVRVSDPEKRRRARRSALLWMTGGTIASFVAWRVVPDAIRVSKPQSAVRIAVASVYSAGFGASIYGGYRLLTSARRRYETTVVMPDEALLRSQRSLLASWQADSLRLSSLNARRDGLRRISIQLLERP